MSCCVFVKLADSLWGWVAEVSCARQVFYHCVSMSTYFNKVQKLYKGKNKDSKPCHTVEPPGQRLDKVDPWITPQRF